MRATTEIQRAHDVLHAYVSRELDVDQTECSVRTAAQLLTILCWVLECEAGEPFARTLEAVTETAAAAGFELTSTAVPLRGRPGEG
jgi:hypothetical protein